LEKEEYDKYSSEAVIRMKYILSTKCIECNLDYRNVIKFFKINSESNIEHIICHKCIIKYRNYKLDKILINCYLCQTAHSFDINEVRKNFKQDTCCIII